MNIEDITKTKNAVVDLCQEMVSMKVTLMEHEKFFRLVKEMRVAQVNCTDLESLKKIEDKVDIYLSLKEQK